MSLVPLSFPMPTVCRIAHSRVPTMQPLELQLAQLCPPVWNFHLGGNLCFPQGVNEELGMALLVSHHHLQIWLSEQHYLHIKMQRKPDSNYSPECKDTQVLFFTFFSSALQ